MKRISGWGRKQGGKSFVGRIGDAIDNFLENDDWDYYGLIASYNTKFWLERTMEDIVDDEKGLFSDSQPAGFFLIVNSDDRIPDADQEALDWAGENIERRFLNHGLAGGLSICGGYAVKDGKIETIVQLSKTEIRINKLKHFMKKKILAVLWFADKNWFNHVKGHGDDYLLKKGWYKYTNWLTEFDANMGYYVGRNRLCSFCGEESVEVLRANPNDGTPPLSATCEVCDNWISDSKKRIFREVLDDMIGAEK